nr:unnamed protein product [Digitaria exilis]
MQQGWRRRGSSQQQGLGSRGGRASKPSATLLRGEAKERRSGRAIRASQASPASPEGSPLDAAVRFGGEVEVAAGWRRRARSRRAREQEGGDPRWRARAEGDPEARSASEDGIGCRFAPLSSSLLVVVTMACGALRGLGFERAG